MDFTTSAYIVSLAERQIIIIIIIYFYFSFWEGGWEEEEKGGRARETERQKKGSKGQVQVGLQDTGPEHHQAGPKENQNEEG